MADGARIASAPSGIDSCVRSTDDHCRCCWCMRGVQVDRVAYVHSLKELAIPISQQVGVGGKWLGCNITGAWRCMLSLVTARQCSSGLPKPFLPVRTQTAITKDNVTITIDGVLYVKVPA